MSALSPEAALQELKPREPIFHRRQYGTTRGALEEMTDEAFWEVGASGRVYRRDYWISTLLERYKNPEPHDWPCNDFSITELADNLFLRVRSKVMHSRCGLSRYGWFRSRRPP